jgi:hypothetical protein
LLSLFTAIFLLAGSSNLWSQVLAYGYSESSAVPYTEISGDAVVATATGITTVLSMNSFASLPFGFLLNGVAQTTAYMSSNGFLTLGSTAPSAFTTIPISTAFIVANGVVSPWSGDLNTFFNIASGTGTMRWEMVGSAPNLEIVFQWKDFRPVFSTSTTNVFGFSFQVRLLENGLIKIVYGPGSFAIGSTLIMGTNNRQIGLRGATTVDYNNRVFSNFANPSAAGTVNSSANSYIIAINFPASGLTLTWIPPTPHHFSRCAFVTCTGSPTAGTVTPVSQSI